MSQGPSTTNQTAESGRFSLAGFIFQLLGNGVEAMQLGGDLDADDPRDVLLLERFGQDSATSDHTGNLKSLNQYKFTSTSGKLSRAELRIILEKFLASANNAGARIDDLDFSLITDQEWKDAAARLWSTKEDTKTPYDQRKQQIIAQLIESKQDGNLPDAALLADILMRTKLVKTDDVKLTRKLREEAAKFGVRPTEAESRVDEVLGLLLRQSAQAGRRSVNANDFYHALTRIPHPYRLLSEESSKVRFEETEVFRQMETDGRDTLPRSVVQDVARAMREYPLVVLVGDGGSGKSVVIFDVANLINSDATTTPGFAYVEKARNIKEPRLINSISRWRNQNELSDGPDVKRSLERLSVAFTERPTVAICADGIDETRGLKQLPPEAVGLLQQLAVESLFQHKTGSWSNTILLSCRGVQDWKRLITHRDFVEGETCRIFNLGKFGHQEMDQLLNTLDDPGCRQLIRNRIARDADLSLGNVSDSDELIDEMRFDLLRRPVLWGIFKEMSTAEKLQFLKSDDGSLPNLAERYFDRFAAKANVRIPVGLAKYDVSGTLARAAKAYGTDPSKPRDFQQHWRKPATDYGCTPQVAMVLYDEAETAGIIRRRANDRTWSWEHPWFFEYLLTRDEA